MRDIGKHPDSGNPIEREPEYDTRIEYDFVCPFCEEDIDEDYDLEGFFYEAINELTLDTTCWNCDAGLEVTFLFVALAEPYSARVGFEVKGTKRVR